VGEIRWREWGTPPEPVELSFWVELTGREAGRDALPVTWVAVDAGGQAVGVVGLGEFDPPELRDRTPWVLGMVVDPVRRGLGVGRALLSRVDEFAVQCGHSVVWVATGGPAVPFYEACGYEVWQLLPDSTILRRVL
jgi:GNAT superfamily N-acetyltransferase